MIERYFRAGVRYLWNKPHDAVSHPPNVAIVPSGMAANNLTYDGLDGHRAAVDPLLLANHANAVLGLAKGANVPHSWLDYAPGHTAQVRIGGNDILSGYMSGCLIVRGTYGDAMSAFHVGTDDRRDVNQTVKQNMAQNLPADATGFDPAAAWAHGEIAAIQANLGGLLVAAEKILALVTTAGEFYSILMFSVIEGERWFNPAGQKYWCVGGRKLVPPLNRVRLMAKLLS
jgi:hypothetical protein